jgi:hypothetical protein
MRLLFLLLFAGYSLITAGQQRYHCEYKETILFPIPDSIMKSLREQITAQGLPAETADLLAKQLNLPGILTSCWRKVDARPDSTFILVAKNNEDDGNVKLNIPDTKLLFLKGEIYQYNPDTQKYLTKDTVLSAPRIFEKNRERKTILNHVCSVYTSTDSSCRIWAAEDLPGYINPGVWVGDIKGAVIAYELKQKGSSIHAEIAKIE